MGICIHNRLHHVIKNEFPNIGVIQVVGEHVAAQRSTRHVTEPQRRARPLRRAQLCALRADRPARPSEPPAQAALKRAPS